MVSSAPPPQLSSSIPPVDDIIKNSEHLTREIDALLAAKREQVSQLGSIEKSEQPTQPPLRRRSSSSSSLPQANPASNDELARHNDNVIGLLISNRQLYRSAFQSVQSNREYNKPTKDLAVQTRIKKNNVNWYKSHLNHEIESFDEYDTTYQNIELLPEESVLTPEQIATLTPHERFLKRLEDENMHRMKLEARITRLNKKQSLLEKDIDGMVAKKDQFESTVLKWLKGAQEIQKETGLDLSKSKHNDNLTRLLPKPLFNLYGKLTGFRQNFDSNVIVQIAGDIPEAEKLLNLPPQSPERYSQNTESLTAVDRDAETETESSPAYGRNQASKFDSQVSSRASTPSSENGETDVSMHAETVEENVVDKRQREDDDEMDVDVEFKRRKVDNPDTEDVSSENVFKKWPVHITMVITNSQHPYILRLTFSYLTELKLVSVHHSIDPTPELSNSECTYPSDNIFRDLLWSGDEGLELPTVSSRSMVSSDIELSPALLHGFVYQWLQRLVELHVDEPVYTGSGDIPTALVELDTIDALKKLMERWNGWLEVHYVVNILGKNEMIYVPPPLSISKLEEESQLSLSEAKCVTDEDATSLVVALEFNYLDEPRPLQIHIPCTFPHSPPSVSFTSFVSTFAPDLRPRLLDHLSRLTTILSSITFPAVNKDESDRPGTPVIGRDREKVKNEKEREKEREREFKKLGVVGKVIVTAVRGLKLVLSGLKKDQDEDWEEVAEAMDNLK